MGGPASRQTLEYANSDAMVLGTAAVRPPANRFAIGSGPEYEECMNPLWLLRLTRWARNPPSPHRAMVIFAIIALCLMLYGIESVFGWPDWLTPERLPRGRVLR